MAVPTPTYTDGYWGYDTFVENDVTYARIVSCSITSGTTISIPDTVGGYVVKEIGKGGSNETIWDNSSIPFRSTLTHIPSTVTAINNYAFHNGVKVSMDLGTILPPDLITIGNYAFGNGQTYGGELVLPDTVTTIGEHAFYTGNYTKIVIPPNVTSIGSNAFYMCKATTLLVLKTPSKPTLGSGCFGLNSNSSMSTTKTYPVQSVHNWASTVLNSYKNNKTEFTFSALPVYEHLTYFGDKIQVDSAIRDGNGLKIDTNYVPVTRAINGNALSSDVTLSAADVSAVPTTRTVNSKPLSSNISLSASDVGALPSNTTYVSTVNGQSGAVTISVDSSLSTSSTNPVQNKAIGLLTTTGGSLGSVTTSTEGNQIALKGFVNSSISTNTATFRGTYSAVTDLSFSQSTVDAWTNPPSSSVVSSVASAITTKLSALSITPTNNDYVFVTVDQTPVGDVSEDWYWRFKYNGSSWEYEYSLNNTGFTQAQWNAINSGITSSLVSKLNNIGFTDVSLIEVD